MSITKRTLTNWRRDALKTLNNLKDNAESFGRQIQIIRDPNEKILRLTQILIDQELMKGNK